MLGTKKVTVQVVWCVMRCFQNKKSHTRGQIFSQMFPRNITLHQMLLNCWRINVSPLQVKEKYCCSKCITIVWDYYGAHIDLTETKNKLFQGAKAKYYIGSKMVFSNTTDKATFITPRKGLKRLQTSFPSPKNVEVHNMKYNCKN